MLLAINDTKSLADLQEKFSECFPNLKIEFYKCPHHWKEYSPVNERISPQQKVGAVAKKHEPDVLEIKSCYQTGRVEQDFYHQFGLNVQVFHLENGHWIQSSESDSNTLKQQQEKSAASKVVSDLEASKPDCADA